MKRDSDVLIRLFEYKKETQWKEIEKEKPINLM